jgi:hypothetical protein
MRAEQAPSEWVFRRPGEPYDGPFGLVVLDGTPPGRRRPLNAPLLILDRTVAT